MSTPSEFQCALCGKSIELKTELKVIPRNSLLLKYLTNIPLFFKDLEGFIRKSRILKDQLEGVKNLTRRKVNQNSINIALPTARNRFAFVLSLSAVQPSLLRCHDS